MNADRLFLFKMKLLVVEDDDDIAHGIRRGLVSAGCVVDLARDGVLGEQLAAKNGYAAIVLDLMLPLRSGTEVCERLRSAGNSTPIIMLTAKDSISDRIQGLECGADDYLVKPFEFPELLARLKALVRRDKVNRGRVVEIGHVSIDLQRRLVTIEGAEVSLNFREYELLEALALNEGRILTRDAIQFRIWNNEDSYSNIVDVQIRRLRLKIERPGAPKLIHTIQGVGYSMRRPDGQA